MGARALSQPDARHVTTGRHRHVTASPPRPPGIVVGLRAEARVVAEAARQTHGASNEWCAIGGPAQVAALVKAGAPALVSFGLAGGLDQRHAPGTLILADAVVLPDGEAVATDPAWRERVRIKLAHLL